MLFLFIHIVTANHNWTFGAEIDKERFVKYVRRSILKTLIVLFHFVTKRRHRPQLKVWDSHVFFSFRSKFIQFYYGELIDSY